MFHSQSLLSRKGPLGTIWLAAYFYKKLKKEEIVRTNISSSVDKIIPYAGTSYRIIAQLLLGIVRIFSKKVEILYHDCNETLGRISKVINPDGRHPSCKSNVISHSCKARNIFPCETSHHGLASFPQGEIIEPIISSVEAIVEPQRSTKVTIPENLTLDSFVLEVPVEGDSIDAHQQVTGKGEVEDSWQPITYEGGSSMTYLTHMFSTPRRPRRPSPMPGHLNNGSNGTEQRLILLALHQLESVILWDHMVDLNIEIDEMQTSGIFKNGEEPQADLSHAKCLQSTETSRGSPGSIVVADVQELQQESAPDVETTSSAKVDSEKLPQVNTPSAKAISVVGLDANAKLVQENTPREDALEDFQQVDINISFLGKRNLEARTLSRTHRRLSIPCLPGPASPEFAVKTPAKREQHRMVGKRKRRECLIDEAIVLSNQTLRESIHDSSGLTFKRTKAMHTRLDIWRLYKFYDLDRAFKEPLIPYPSTYLSNHLAKKLLDSRIDTTEAVKKFDDVKDDSLKSSLEREYSFHHENAETSFCCIPGSGCSWEMNDERSKEPSEQDTSSNEVITNQGAFSTRTRSVAQYLRKSFENKKMDQNQTLSLSKALEGKNKKASAIVFYETLVLKAWDCIDVKQEVPYADIILSANGKLYTI